MAEQEKEKNTKSKDNWKKIQERTFTNWFNDRLRGHLKVAKVQVRLFGLSYNHNNYSGFSF